MAPTVRSAFQNRCSDTMSTTATGEPVTTSCMHIDGQRWLSTEANPVGGMGKPVNQTGFSDHRPITRRLPRDLVYWRRSGGQPTPHAEPHWESAPAFTQADEAADAAVVPVGQNAEPMADLGTVESTCCW